MTQAVMIDQGVRFEPSRVEGVSNVIEVAVYPDRLELRGDQGWVSIEYRPLIDQSGPLTIFERTLGWDVRPPIAAIHFSREHYAESFVRFLTEPPVTLYMPAAGPTRSPDSVFARILKALHAGRCRYLDLDDARATRKYDEPLAYWPRTLLQGLMLACLVNFLSFIVSSVVLRGNALSGRVENDHYYFNRPSRQREVSRELWTFNWWHGVTALSGLGVMGVAGLASDGYASFLARRRRAQHAGRSHIQ